MEHLLRLSVRARMFRRRNAYHTTPLFQGGAESAGTRHAKSSPRDWIGRLGDGPRSAECPGRRADDAARRRKWCCEPSPAKAHEIIDRAIAASSQSFRGRERINI